MKSRLVVILVASFALAGGRTDSATSHDGPNDKVAIIGDSLTYQGGAGEARITDLIREHGHGGGGIYVWGVGGKRLTVDDSGGDSTLDNIAAARHSSATSTPGSSRSAPTTATPPKRSCVPA